jgi:hypothetical protein
MTVKFFDSVDDMFDHVEREQERGLELAKKHPVKIENLRHGDCFVSIRKDLGVAIFGVVIETSEQYPEDNESIAESRANGFVFAKCASPLCVEGELRDIHITRINGKIEKDLFDRAKANGWRHVEASN